MIALAALTPAKARRHTKRHTGWAVAVLGFIAINMLYFVGDLNADWASYEYLFDVDGGWLSDQGRDKGFLGLMAAAKAISDYEHFRLAIGIYFFVFAVLFFRRWRRHLTNETYFWAFVGLLPLLVPKFTVIMREGLAVTLVLVSFTILFEREKLYRGVKALWPSCVLLAVAASIHSGTIVFLAALTIPAMVGHLTMASTPNRAVRNAAVLTVVGISTFLYFADWDRLLRLAAESLLGDLPTEESDIDSSKSLYWAVKCLTVAYLAWKIRATEYRQPAFSMFMRYTAYAVIPALQIIVIYLVFAGYPKFIDASAIRAYHTVFYSVFSLAALTTRATPLTAIIATALLVDEYRVMIVATL